MDSEHLFAPEAICLSRGRLNDTLRHVYGLRVERTLSREEPVEPVQKRTSIAALLAAQQNIYSER